MTRIEIKKAAAYPNGDIKLYPLRFRVRLRRSIKGL